MFATLLPCLAAGLLVAADAAEEPSKKELEKVQGAWTAQRMTLNGQDISGEDAAKVRLVFKGDVATVGNKSEDKKDLTQFRFKFGPEYTPKLVDLTALTGDEKGKVIEGIYELKDDEMTLCVRVIGKDRPAKFESTEGSNIVLAVFKREK
jgi:uncharacterized protein (TIGR03067 family)